MSTTPNPVCTDGSDLPPPPSIGEEEDPAEPHPAEPRGDGDLATLIQGAEQRR
jgi:hypothetical protein